MNALLLDDHPLILSAMQALVQGLGPHVRAVGVETPNEAFAYLDEHQDVDIVLLDLKLGIADGFEVLVELRSKHPMVPVVIVSASESPADVIRALDCGAMGFVPKRASNEMLFEALHMVLSGGLYVPPLLTQQAPAQPALSEPSRSAMLDEIAAADQAISPGNPAQRMPASSMRDDARAAQALFDTLGLTPRQLEVLRLLLQGQPNKLIARELGLSVETVKDHVAAVLRALGVNSRTQAVLAVNQMLQRDGRAEHDGRDRAG
ncbi:MAG: response regulator transcription factor [Burkholderiales bacterium]|nr:response regulator transcription factor [Burkholderiales bacterium]